MILAAIDTELLSRALAEIYGYARDTGREVLGLWDPVIYEPRVAIPGPRLCSSCCWLLGTFCGLFKHEALPCAKGCMVHNQSAPPAHHDSTAWLPTAPKQAWEGYCS